MAITPIVHLNGTSAQELKKQQTDILEAADVLMKALYGAMPNARDFYNKPGPENWMELARREHAARITCVQKIMNDAMEIALSVQEQSGV